MTKKSKPMMNEKCPHCGQDFYATEMLRCTCGYERNEEHLRALQEPKSKKPWKFRLAERVGLAFILLSLPFIANITSPSMHEGNLISSIYVLINMPVILLLGKFGDKLANYLFTSPGIFESNTVFTLMCLVFWVSVAFIVGWLMDTKIQKP